MSVAAVVLAGGTAARLGGVDKASLEYAGSTFLERALAATTVADEVVVVGDPVATSQPVGFVREDPPLGGPVAGLLAGRRALDSSPELVVVLAVDMPRVTAGTVARLVDAVGDRDGAVLVDPDGRRQLALVVVTEQLDAVAPAEPHGASVRSLLAGLDLVEVASEGDEGRGVDRWTDLPHGVAAERRSRKS